MTGNSVLERIERYNRGREPERLAIKYARMRANVFTFLRGTAHLFYEDWPRRSPLNEAPAAWICGDLHLENFGGYTAADGREYFDVCDFDEAALAPVTWELARLCVSLLLAAKLIGMKKLAGEALIRHCLEGYADALAQPALKPIDARVAQPDLRRFLRQLSSVHPEAFVNARTAGKGSKRRLRILKDKTLPALAGETKRLKGWWKKQRRQPLLAGFGEMLDVARRITGTGSLGVHRYALLVANDRQARLLELKEAVDAAMIRQRMAPPAPWRDNAARVVAIQSRAAATPRRLLKAVAVGKRPYILRALNPGDDKLTVDKGGARRLTRLAPWLGRAAAASHRRTAGWKGAATLAQFHTFAMEKTWRGQVMDYAIAYKKIVERDWRRFRRAARLPRG